MIDSKITGFWDFKMDEIKIVYFLFQKQILLIQIFSVLFYCLLTYLYDINETFFESYIDYKGCWLEVASDKYIINLIIMFVIKLF